MIVGTLLIVVLSITKNVAAAGDGLQFVFVMAKGPDHEVCNYPGGPKLREKDDGPCLLTEDGRNEAFQLGRLLNTVYRSQLKIKKWNGSENYWAVATTAPRTQNATLIVGAGLENNNQGLSPDYWTQKQLNSTFFGAMPNFLKFMSPQHCPKYFIRLSHQYSQELKNLMQKHQSTILKIHEKFSAINKTKPEHIWMAYETFKRMRQQKDPKSKLLTDDIMKDLKEYSAEFVKIALTSSDDMRKIVGGPILHDLLNDMDELKKGNPQPHAPGGINNKMSIFVASQAILAAQLAVLATNGATLSGQPIKPTSFYPEDGSYLIIELHKKKDKWSVKVWYNNGQSTARQSTAQQSTAWQTLRIKECNEDECPYEKFKMALQKYSTSVQEHEKLCKTS